MKTIKFDQRPPLGGPSFIGTYITDGLTHWIPEINHTVSLRIGGLTVIARITSISTYKYQGEVIRLINISDSTAHNLKVGSAIDFLFDQIFSCST